MMNELGDHTKYVEGLLPAARKALVTITDNASLMEAENFLHKGAELVIVCGSADLVAGVIPKEDVEYFMREIFYKFSSRKSQDEESTVQDYVMGIGY